MIVSPCSIANYVLCLIQFDQEAGCLASNIPVSRTPKKPKRMEEPGLTRRPRLLPTETEVMTVPYHYVGPERGAIAFGHMLFR
jgi:hypothetical protein